MFFISGVIIVAFLLVGIIFPNTVKTVTDALMGGIATYFGWFYILVATFFLVFVLWLMVSRFGKIRLGPNNSRPEFSTMPWFAMLFTAGMGIGLVYYAVSEPIGHFSDIPGKNPPPGQAAVEAMSYTFYHWGLHPWAIYIVLGLAMGYFAFRKGLPLRPASALYPLIGDRIYGWVGNLIDILAVFGTLFGLATSLGLGTQQINTGLNTLFGLPNNTGTQIVIIALISAVAIGSVMFGVDKGIRRLSMINLWLAAALMLVVFIAGPTLAMLTGLANYVGYYLQHLVGISLTVFDPLVPGNPDTNPAAQAAKWQAGNTLFYWGWWISWSPFVGMFVARISYGRTIREFIAGVLFAPVGASLVWFTVFGGAGLHYIMEVGGQARQALLNAEAANAIFVLLKQLPVGGVIAVLLSVLTIIVVTLFFATSSDSGSLVVDMLTNGGDPDPNKYQRLFWASMEGLVTMVLLVVGGATALNALQAAAVTTGLPFAIVLLLICWGLYRALKNDRITDGPPTEPHGEHLSVRDGSGTTTEPARSSAGASQGVAAAEATPEST